MINSLCIDADNTQSDYINQYQPICDVTRVWWRPIPMCWLRIQGFYSTLKATCPYKRQDKQTLIKYTSVCYRIEEYIFIDNNYAANEVEGFCNVGLVTTYIIIVIYKWCRATRICAIVWSQHWVRKWIRSNHTGSP